MNFNAATLLMPGCAVAAGSRRAPVETTSQRQAFERFVDMFYRRRQVRAAFESCVASAGYTDHAAEGSSSRATAMSRLCRKVQQQVEVDVLHTVWERDIGMVHLQVRDEPGAPARSRVDIFRLEADRIVEHWEVVS